MLTQMKSKQHSSGDLVELRKSSEVARLCILRMAQNALCDFIISPSGCNPAPAIPSANASGGIAFLMMLYAAFTSAFMIPLAL